MIHILITLFIIVIIVFIVLLSENISKDWLFICFPIIYIGYKSYNMFKRILEKKYTENDKRKQTLTNITNIYDDIKNSIGNDEMKQISNIINETKNTQNTIGT